MTAVHKSLQQSSPGGKSVQGADVTQLTLPVLHGWTDGVEPKFGDRIKLHFSEGLIEASRRAAEAAHPSLRAKDSPGTFADITTRRRQQWSTSARSLLPLHGPSPGDYRGHCRWHFNRRHIKLQRYSEKRGIPVKTVGSVHQGRNFREVLLTRSNQFTQCVSLLSSSRRVTENGHLNLASYNTHPPTDASPTEELSSISHISRNGFYKSKQNSPIYCTTRFRRWRLSLAFGRYTGYPA